MSDSADAAGGCVTVVLALAAIAIVIYLVFLAVQAMIVCGGIYGAAIALKNYALAFRRNVRPERVPA
ncbi:MAG TPA: hypothetical protein VF017_18425 [Thermoanaerobaculia bacterium]|nr:hypothetical protein [Thermoanaerobaculia bacterium]